MKDPKAIEAAKATKLTDLDKAEAGEKLRNSFAGHFGKIIEPMIAPLGFDWKIGIGIVASFAAREVFVSTMSTVYSVSVQGKGDEETQGLALTMRDPGNSSPVNL